MARKGRFAKPPEWWKHLRKFNKKKFWRQERQGAKKFIEKNLDT